jgi:threonine dehydratase
MNELTGRGIVLQMRELPEGRRLQGARCLQRGLRPERREAAKGVATHSSATTRCRWLCGRTARHSRATSSCPAPRPRRKRPPCAAMAARSRMRAVDDQRGRRSSPRLSKSTGADFVHPYNDPRVIAGQATCSRELMEQVEGLDAVIAPIGGGGMVSGCCLTLSNIAPNVRSMPPNREQADDAYALSRRVTSSPTTRR